MVDGDREVEGHDAIKQGTKNKLCILTREQIDSKVGFGNVTVKIMIH